MTWQRWKGIMKCYPFTEERLARWTPPYIVQIKYDGDRGKAYPHDSGYLLVTSEENPVFSVPHITQVLKSSGLRLTLDFEFYNHELFLEGGHELIHSIVSRTVNLHPRYKEMEIHVFDLDNEKTQMERLVALARLKEKRIPGVVISPYWICETLDEIKEVYDKVINEGYEGIIIRHIYNSYERKRSTFLMKFKPKKKDEYDILGWNEEVDKDGNPKGRIGSLVLSSQKGDVFSVGAGLDAVQKDHLWEVRNSIAGHRAIVHFQHLTNSQIPKGTFDIEIPGLGIK